MRLSTLHRLHIVLTGWGIALILTLLSAATALADGAIGPFPR